LGKGYIDKHGTFCPRCQKQMEEEGDDGDERWDGGAT